MTENGNGTNGASRILSLNDVSRNAKDDQGRTLRHNATVLDAHHIAIEEGNKIHAFYLNQIPTFVARMVQDALIGYGLITLPSDAPPAPNADITGSATPPASSDAHKMAEDGL